MLRFSDRCLFVAALAAFALAAPPATAGGLQPRLHASLAAFPAARVTDTPVTTYHNDYYRSGQYVVPGLTPARAAKMHVIAGFAGFVTGNVYAQPLYWHEPGSSDGRVIVATESNHVEALDAATGKVVWDRFLAPPVQGGVLPCGNIDPEGVTGTPVIDSATGTLYVAASVLASGAAESLVYAIALKSGHVLPGWPVNVGASLKRIPFLPAAQGERGALAFANGQLYVPYGGRYGDCDNYFGTVVAIGTAHPSVTGAWHTTAQKGGIWSVGGVLQADGDLYVATGNTSGASTWGGGEAIVRLTPALKTSRGYYFTPGDWQNLDNEDLDLGGSNPVAIDLGASKLIVALGKDGNAYLADRTNLGGIGGQLAMQQVSKGEIIGGAATWIAGSSAFVAFQGGGSASVCSSAQGLTVLRVTAGTAPAIRTAWCAGVSGAGDPIVTTSNGTADRIVWMIGAEGDNRLHGFSAANGAPVYTGGGSNDGLQNTRHMTTFIAAQGRFYVATDGRVYAFAP